MGDNTSIEWARHPTTGKGASWNPLLARRLDNGKVGYHCEHVTDGCSECYAETFNARNLPNRGTGLPFKPGHRKDVDIFLDERMLLLPTRWKAPRGIFVCSMTDLFGSFVPDELIDRMMAVMALCPQHVFMVLTKRPERARDYLSAARSHPVGLEALRLVIDETVRNPGSDIGSGVMLQGDIPHLQAWPLPNLWLGTSVEDQESADQRIPDLLAASAAKRFISAEPLLGPINLNSVIGGTQWMGGQRGHGGMHHGSGTPDCPRELHHHHDERCGQGIDWVIIGGMSGPKKRDYRYSWARSLIRQCAAAFVPAFHKQVGSSPINDLDYVGVAHPEKLKNSKGGDMAEWPEDLRVRQMPGAQ